MKRVIGLVSVSVMALLGLTACDPPMPPSVAAQIAEQTFTCVDGSAKVSFPGAMDSLADEWLTSMQGACTDPSMSFEKSVAGSAGVVLSSYPVSACKPLVTVPVAVESADIAFSLSYSTTLNLSPKSVAGIFNGEITNWNDQAIVAENPDTEMPDLPIILSREVDRLAFETLSSYTEHYGHKITDSFDLTENPQDVSYLDEGQIALLPHSVAFNAGFTTASLITEKSYGDSQIANADVTSISSGASQWVARQNGDNVDVNLDYGKDPEILSGLDAASPPYQAVYPVYLNICEDTLLNRAVAFFFLRMDSQGSLGVSVYTQLPESTRVVSLVAVKEGLPITTASADPNK